MSDVLPYLWTVKSTIESEEYGTLVLEAGALCVHVDGVLMTITHGIKPHGTPFVTSKLEAKKCDEKSYRLAHIIDIIHGNDFGISILRVVKKKNEEMKALDIPRTVEIKEGAGIFSHSNNADLHFFELYGYVLHNYGANARDSFKETDNFPQYPVDPRNINSVFFTNKYNMEEFANHIVFKDPLMSDALKGVYPNILTKLKQSLPLVQVGGLSKFTFDGNCGCPVYTTDKHTLLGLYAFSSGTFQFIVPANVLREVFDQNQKAFDGKGASRVSGEGSSSNSKKIRIGT